MKRWRCLLLVMALCLTGCKKKPASDLPGAEEVPEGIEWQLWEDYTPTQLQRGEETIPVLIAMDAIHMAIYYDRAEQELVGSLTIPTPLTDVAYSREHLRIQDENGDGWDDICIPDILENGDRILSWWLWDGKAYTYAPEYTQYQEDISADVSWRADKQFISASMDTPDGPQDLLILVQEQEVLVYLDQRQECLWGSAAIPTPLSQEAQEHLAIYTYLDCVDLNGDGWGDLQLPCRWEEAADGSVYQYAHCWMWDPVKETYVYHIRLSADPVI